MLLVKMPDIIGFRCVQSVSPPFFSVVVTRAHAIVNIDLRSGYAALPGTLRKEPGRSRGRETSHQAYRMTLSLLSNFQSISKSQISRFILESGMNAKKEARVSTEFNPLCTTGPLSTYGYVISSYGRCQEECQIEFLSPCRDDGSAHTGDT